MTPTARSLAFLRRNGYQAAVVEKWLRKIDRRADLWRFGDLLAAHPVDRAIVIVQTTTLGNLSSRLAKAKRQPELLGWLKSGGRFEVHGWDGSRLKRVAVRSEDLVDVVIAAPASRRRRKGARQGELFATS